MLRLSRAVGETLVINGNVTVTVLGESNGKIELGVNAPKDVTVDRLEVHMKKVGGVKKENDAA